MNTYNLNLYKMVGFTSDSAAAIIGKNGVSENLRIKVKEKTLTLYYSSRNTLNQKFTTG